MEVRTQSRNGPVVAKLPHIVANMAQEVTEQQEAWLEQLQADPMQFGQVEREVHEAFRHHADQLVAGLLAQASSQSEALENSKKA